MHNNIYFSKYPLICPLFEATGDINPFNKSFNIITYIDFVAKKFGEGCSPDPIHGNDNYFYYIYISFNLINLRYYIGAHRSETPFDRNYRGSGTLIKKACDSYGWENVITVPLFYCRTNDDLFKLEMAIITQDLIDAQKDIIYNLKIGGYGGLNLTMDSISKICTMILNITNFGNPDVIIFVSIQKRLAEIKRDRHMNNAQKCMPS